LLGTELTAKQMDFVETIQNSGETLLKIINEILDLSKIEAGKMTLENIELNLEVLVDQVITMFAERAHSKGLELVTQIQKNVPKTLLGDPVRIRQIITNLVANGIKFTDKGMVTLQISLLHQENETATVQFKVTDTGIGIPADLQSRLFRPFSQADGSTTRRYGGTGLGLAICKQLTELMGGEIDVESHPGQGSTFRFSIPLARPHKKEEDTRQNDPDGLKKLRVLLVDNNAANRDLLQQQLTEWEMTTEAAETGLQALEQLRNAVHRAKPFDLVIEDMLLPGMDGMELARAIKSDPLIAQTKLVMLTSFAMRGHGDEARQSGIVAYLTKPVRQTHLRNCLLQVMHRTDNAGPQSLITRYTLASTSSLLSVPQLPQMRVLLVEDIEANQVVARLILENLHCRVDVASNGLKALGMLAENSYDLVFMDCQMPLMDGFETTAVIREQEEQSGKHIIIVALTAGAMEGDRERCLQVGMDDYISKPFRPEDFERALQRWVVGSEPGAVPFAAASSPAPESAIPVDYEPDEEELEDDDTPTLTPESGSGLMPVTNHSIPPSPVLDESTITQLLDLTRQDTGVLFRLMTMSFDTLVPFPDALQKAFARADFEHIGKIAHKLRGTGGSIGAIGIIRIGQSLEGIRSSAALADAPFLVAEFRAELTRLKEEINRRFHP
jgi:CheY-like chemotaxis protein/HPt (histidine-containing phosphotransfer) domain-containing protein/two-component sensor histidine kinase